MPRALPHYGTRHALIVLVELPQVMPLPLAGRRICITRTRSQSSALAERLEQLGARPMLLPTIEIAPPCSFAGLDAALLRLATFDWLLFTSANAVEAFVRRAAELNVEPSPHRLAAIGFATAAALESAGVTPRLPPVLIPPSAVAESLGEAMLAQVTALLAMGGSARLLLVRAEQARNTLPDLLTACGAQLTIASAYSNRLPAASLALLPEIFATAPDAITFTSSSTATNLVALLAAANLTLPPACRRISIGPITSATLESLALPPHAQAEHATMESLVEAVLHMLPPLRPSVYPHP